MSGNFTGGCLCQALRYQSSATPVTTGYCHCTLCRQSTGAPVLAWASFPVEAFDYTRGTPEIYQSSESGHREFCPRCGTQIAFRSLHEATTVDVNVGSLDDPTTVQPQYHIWCGSRIEWFDTDDELPRYERGLDAGGAQST